MTRPLHVDRTLTSRYECKYLVPRSLVGSLRRFIRSFTRPDRFSMRQPDLRYPICSVYFDGPHLELYRMTVLGLKNRFKLRVRTYSDDPSSPVFFEVKKRVNGIVRKSRASIDRATAARLLEARSTPGPESTGSLPAAIEEFHVLGRRLSAAPMLKIRYDREAYESTGGDPVRITFDRELVHAIPARGDLHHGDGDWRPTPLEGVILEIKFTDCLPAWVCEMIRTFQLGRRSVAKYVLSMNECRCRRWSADG